MKRYLAPANPTLAICRKGNSAAEQAAPKKARQSAEASDSSKHIVAPAAPARSTSTSATALVHGGWKDLGQGSRVGYWPRMLSGMSQLAMKTLLEEVDWQQRDLVIFGRTVAQPRLIAYMADPDTPPYTYSGLTLQPTPWTEVVLRIKATVEQLHPNTHFNSCLLNLYKGGSHHVSWHSDNEKLYGHQPTIASVSFGAARDFVLRHNVAHDRKITTTLSAGDVLIMSGATQDHWQHSIPKCKGISQPRINLTFRTIVSCGD